MKGDSSGAKKEEKRENVKSARATGGNDLITNKVLFYLFANKALNQHNRPGAGAVGCELWINVPATTLR